MSFVFIVQTLLIGLASAGLYLGFNQCLNYFDHLREQYPWIVFGLPIVFGISYYLRHKTLYFPQKISDLEESQSGESLSIWNRKMSLFHYAGACLAHLSGASVGREGVIVMATSGLMTFVNWNLQFWIPVSAAIAFAVVTGSKWISVVFMIEMYVTNWQQKVLGFIGAWAGLLLLETFKSDQLFHIIDFKDQSLLGDRLLFCLTLAVLCGFLAQGYKKLYFYLSSGYKKKLIVSFLIVCGLAFVMYQDSFRSLQSLSLGMIQYYVNTAQYAPNDLMLIALKVFLTAFFVGLGFFGGEYVPLAMAGASLGVYMSHVFHVPVWFGLSLGAFLILSGVTQLKWTFLFLALILSDWNYIILFYFTFSIANRIAGDESLYFKNPRRKQIFQTNMFMFR